MGGNVAQTDGWYMTCIRHHDCFAFDESSLVTYYFKNMPFG